MLSCFCLSMSKHGDHISPAIITRPHRPYTNTCFINLIICFNIILIMENGVNFFNALVGFVNSLYLFIFCLVPTIYTDKVFLVWYKYRFTVTATSHYYQMMLKFRFNHDIYSPHSIAFALLCYVLQEVERGIIPALRSNALNSLAGFILGGPVKYRRLLLEYSRYIAAEIAYDLAALLGRAPFCDYRV